MGKVMNISVIVIIVLILLFGFGNPLFISDKRDISADHANLPMINTAAVRAYNSGEITKDVALRQIDKRLDELVSSGDIHSWQYNDVKGEYLVVMKNDVVFSYQMN